MLRQLYCDHDFLISKLILHQSLLHINRRFKHVNRISPITNRLVRIRECQHGVSVQLIASLTLDLIEGHQECSLFSVRIHLRIVIVIKVEVKLVIEFRSDLKDELQIFTERIMLYTFNNFVPVLIKFKLIAKAHISTIGRLLFALFQIQITLNVAVVSTLRLLTSLFSISRFRKLSAEVKADANEAVDHWYIITHLMDL